MHRVLIGSLLTLVTVAIGLPALAVSLDLDPTFSDDGIVRWPLNDGRVTSLAKDGDQIVTVGRSAAGRLPRVMVARFNDDGSFDETFGDQGVASAQAPGMSVSADLWVLDDGRLVTAYNHKTGIVVHRWTANGALDPTFSGDGERLIRFDQTGYRPIPQVVVDGQQRIVVAGMAEVNEGQNAVIARLLESGQLDDSLAGDGTVSINLGVVDWVDALATDSNDRILLGTDYWNLDAEKVPDYAAVVRLRQNGSFDTSFSDNGVMRFRMIADSVNYPVDIDVDAAGVITVPAIAGAEAYGAARLLPDGSLDQTYGHDGVLSIGCLCGLYDASVVGGRVAFAGTKGYGSSGYDDTAIVVRISADGARVDRQHFDLFPGDEREQVESVLIDGERTLIGGQSLRRPFLSRLG